MKAVTMRGRHGNTKIRKDLETKPILEYIERKQLSCWGHTKIMNRNILAKKKLHLKYRRMEAEENLRKIEIPQSKLLR